MRLVLASASPRRRALLTQMGLKFEVNAQDVDESVESGETPAEYVERLARAKAVAGYLPGSVTIGADTTVVIDDEILGKPSGINGGLKEGVDMLMRLSGREHQVLTGLAGFDGERLESCVTAATVRFVEVDEDTAKRYWATGEGADKAGGYGIQEIGGIFAEHIVGSYSAVVGLPLAQTEMLLRKLDIDTWSMRIDG